MSAILAASISPLTSPDFGDYAFKPLIDDEPLASVSLSIRPLLQLHAGSGARLAVGPAGTAWTLRLSSTPPIRLSPCPSGTADRALWG